MGDESKFELAMDALEVPIEILKSGNLNDIESHEAEALYQKCHAYLAAYQELTEGEIEEIEPLNFDDVA